MPLNTDGGYGFGGIEAINILPLNTSGRRLRITTNEVFENQDFGRFFQDLPPALLLTSISEQPQVGQDYTFKLITSDDLGISSITAMSNGVATSLNEENEGTFTPAFPGELTINATVTDTGGQRVEQSWKLFILDENGDLPYDPAALAEQQGSGLTSLRIFTPSPGDVPTENLEVVGSITAPSGSVPNWKLSYAPIETIDPNDLVTPDEDYIEIGNGAENIFSSSLGLCGRASPLASP